VTENCVTRSAALKENAQTRKTENHGIACRMQRFMSGAAKNPHGIRAVAKNKRDA
jgi:hypothetical protein